MHDTPGTSLLGSQSPRTADVLARLRHRVLPTLPVEVPAPQKHLPRPHHDAAVARPGGHALGRVGVPALLLGATGRAVCQLREEAKSGFAYRDVLYNQHARADRPGTSTDARRWAIRSV